MRVTKRAVREVHETSDGRIFRTAEQAQSHERKTLLFDLVHAYLEEGKKSGDTLYLNRAVEDLAMDIYHILLQTPLADPKPVGWRMQ